MFFSFARVFLLSFSLVFIINEGMTVPLSNRRPPINYEHKKSSAGCASPKFSRTPTRLQDSSPIVYVYTVSEFQCKWGIHDYMKFSLEQALISHPHSEVYFASNFGVCNKSIENVDKWDMDIIPKWGRTFKRVDTTKIQSSKTRHFLNISDHLFRQDHMPDLWLNAALRFFILEEVMESHNLSSIIHVEGDNLLYGDTTDILPVLRAGYPGLAATPLTSSGDFVTASVLWVSNRASLSRFNDFLLALGDKSSDEWNDYINWLRPRACCKPKTNEPKPFAINEMSMLAYYEQRVNSLHCSSEFVFLPVVPSNDKAELRSNNHNRKDLLNRYVADGERAGPATGVGIWDPNSWGQNLGGTHKKRGRDRGFNDPTHIIFSSLHYDKCRPVMACSSNKLPQYAQTHTLRAIATSVVSSTNNTTAAGGSATSTVAGPVPADRANKVASTTSSAIDPSSAYPLSNKVVINEALFPPPLSHRQIRRRLAVVALTASPLVPPVPHTKKQRRLECYTMPFVVCEGAAKNTTTTSSLSTSSSTSTSSYVPLWNLHVHSKHTQAFVSMPCDCDTAAVL